MVLNRLWPRIRGPEQAMPRHIWDADTRLIDLTGCGDWLTLRDLYAGGIAAFGSTGSGKTSSMALIAYALMKLGCGFVWLAAKPDEVDLVSRLAERAGRSDDLIILGENTLGRITEQRFNPLEYEASIPTTGTNSLASYLSDLFDILTRKEGEQNGNKGQRFWQDQFTRLLRYCIDTARLAGRPISVDLLRRIQLTGPKSVSDLSDDNWKKRSVCRACLIDAEVRLDTGEIDEYDFKRIVDFWFTDYANLDSKPRATIDVMFATLADAFLSEEPIRSLLNSTTTVSPEDVIERGRIVVLSLPTSIYHAAGKMVQASFKLSFQRAMLRRRKPSDGSPLRPCVLWMDEAHNFVHYFDARYFAEVRSNRGISVFMDQSVGGIMSALGMTQYGEVDGFLANLSTKLFFQSNSPQTCSFASEAIGRVMREEKSDSVNASLDGSSVGQTTTLQERTQVVSGMFAFLKRGGDENHRIVSAIALKPGLFRATGTNWALVRFQQTDLTK